MNFFIRGLLLLFFLGAPDERPENSMASVKPEEGDPKAEIYPRDQHQISRTLIDPDALKIMYRLARAGFKAYLVGGGVRDLLLGKRPKDFDIATDATPKKIKTLFRNSRVIGRRFKLVHVFFGGGKNIEVSTFRDVTSPQESLENGDSPELESMLVAHDNTFGTEATDAVRRDLTINALFYDAISFSIIDYVGGMRDLRNRIVRIIGDPDIRFAEDPVRLLRVVRHAARAGFSIEPACRSSLIRCRELLKTSSQVRVFEEIKKDLYSGHILPILRGLAETGLLELLIPVLAQDDAMILQEGSHLPICLERLDEMIRSGEEVMPTVVLALLALFAPKKEEHQHLIDITSRFESEDEIHDHIHYFFSSLTVPRKERERIEWLLAAWQRLCKVHGSKFKPGSVLRGAESSDLIALYRAVHGEDEDRILDALRGATKRVNSHGSGGRRRRG